MTQPIEYNRYPFPPIDIECDAEQLWDDVDSLLYRDGIVIAFIAQTTDGVILQTEHNKKFHIHIDETLTASQIVTLIKKELGISNE